jgi:hypothetical protein
MKIKGINYNWRPVVRKYMDGYGTEQIDATCDFDSRFIDQKYNMGFNIPNKKCIRIEEHIPQGEGDKWFYDIYYDDNTMDRTFNPNEIFYENISK